MLTTIPKDDRPDGSCGYSILTKYPRLLITANMDKCRLYWRLNNYLTDAEFAVLSKALETYGDLCREYGCQRMDIIHDLRGAKPFTPNQLSAWVELISKIFRQYNVQNLVGVCEPVNIVYRQLMINSFWNDLEDLRMHWVTTFTDANKLLNEIRGYHCKQEML